MKFKPVFFVIFFLMGVWGSSVLAQPPVDDMSGPPDNHRERLRQWVQFRLVQELDMSEEQSLKFFPRFNALDDHRQETHKQKQQKLRELHNLLSTIVDPDQPGEDMERQIITALEELDTLEQEALKKRNELRAEMMEVLTPVQKAKYVIFEARFEREIREMIQDVRRHRGGRGHGYNRTQD
ncbi:MAG: hypothetical protein D6675_11165 [Gemmatimonadetes bacterium]|nr:MAG: hypothetical protein D6675_11165 [Gemmatimonadota bacterium]